MKAKVYNVSRSMLTAIEAHYKDPSIPYPGEDNAILFELTPYLESAGFHDPLSKVWGMVYSYVSLQIKNLPGWDKISWVG